MTYNLVYSPTAEQDLARLAGRYPHLLDYLEAGLRDLAERPASLSRPSAFPYPPGSQLYQFFHAEPGGARHVFSVLFRYGADETALQIAQVGHYELAEPWE
jgi:hypothetical protein